MNFRQRLRFAIKNRNPVGLAPEIWQELPPWQKRAIRKLRGDLKRLSDADFESRRIEPQEFLFAAAVLSKRYSRRLSGYGAKLKPLLASHNQAVRLLAVQQIGAGMGLDLSDHKPSPELLAASEYDAGIASEQMVSTYDERLERAIAEAQVEAEEEGKSGRLLVIALIAALLLWHQKETDRQNRLTAISETGKAHSGQWQLVFDFNVPQLRSATIVRVVPEYSTAIRDTIPVCAEVVSGNPYTMEELERWYGLPPYHL